MMVHVFMYIERTQSTINDDDEPTVWVCRLAMYIGQRGQALAYLMYIIASSA